jgi:integrase
MSKAKSMPMKHPRNRRESLKVTLKPFASVHHVGFSYVVYWPSLDPGRPRNSRRFRTKKSAEKFVIDKEVEIANRGREAAALHDSVAKDAAWAVKELKPYNATLRDVVADYIRRRQSAEKSSLIDEAIDEFIDMKKAAGKSARYIGDLRYKLRNFADDHGGLLLSEITPMTLDQWLEGLGVSPVTRNGFRRVLTVFFEWGGKRGYCDREQNPARATEIATETAKRVPIFTAGELRVTLDTAPAELVPVIALGAFAGLRPEEIRRLDWTAVDLLRKRIDIDAGVSKTAAHRYVPISETLFQWLQPYAKSAGKVAPLNLYRRLWNFHLILAEKDDKNGRPAVIWKHNALRHSFASYALAKEEDAARVALWLGHASPSMTFKHYRERVTPEAAAEWFAVLPMKKKGKGKKIVNMEVAA